MLRRYFFIAETALGLASLAALDLSLTGEASGYIHVVPHPYWAVVLLIACRYGLLEGITAGIMAALTYVLLGSASLDFGSSVFPYGAYKMPFFFFLIGAVTGQIRTIYKNKQARLQEAHDEVVSDLDELAALHSAVLKSKEHLERRIAFQTHTMLTLVERLNTMETLAPEKIYKSIPELLVKELSAKCASVYFVKNGRLILSERHGEIDNPLPDVQDLSTGIMGEAIKKRRVVSISRNYGSEAASDQPGVLSVPLMREDGSTLAVINIERISFYDFTMNTERLFGMLASWLAVVIDKAIRFQTLRDKNIEDEITGAYNYAYFKQRLSYETARAKRYKYPLSILMLKIDELRNMQAPEQRRTLNVVGATFKKILRSADIISKYEDDDTFAILLPHTPTIGAEKAAERLQRSIEESRKELAEKRIASLTLKVAVSTYDPVDKPQDAMVARAVQGLTTGCIIVDATETAIDAKAFSDID